MNQRRIVRRKDYYSVDVHYGKYQCNRHYIIEKDISSDNNVDSMEEGRRWFDEFVEENRDQDLAFAEGTVWHEKVAIVEDEDGDQIEDWSDVDEDGESLYWDDHEDDEEEEDLDEDD